MTTKPVPEPETLAVRAKAVADKARANLRERGFTDQEIEDAISGKGKLPDA